MAASPASTALPDSEPHGGGRIRPPLPSFLAPDLIVRGLIRTTGAVEIDGVVEGDVQAQHLTVGSQGRLRASIDADDAVVSGNVVGLIKARSVTFTDGCKFSGEIQYERLAAEPDSDIEATLHPVVGANARTFAETMARSHGARRRISGRATAEARLAAERPPPRGRLLTGIALAAVVMAVAGAVGVAVINPAVRDWRAGLIEAVKGRDVAVPTAVRDAAAPALPATVVPPAPERAAEPPAPAAPESRPGETPPPMPLLKPGAPPAAPDAKAPDAKAPDAKAPTGKAPNAKPAEPAPVETKAPAKENGPAETVTPEAGTAPPKPAEPAPPVEAAKPAPRAAEPVSAPAPAVTEPTPPAAPPKVAEPARPQPTQTRAAPAEVTPVQAAPVGATPTAAPPTEPAAEPAAKTPAPTEPVASPPPAPAGKDAGKDAATPTAAPRDVTPGPAVPVEPAEPAAPSGGTPGDPVVPKAKPDPTPAGGKPPPPEEPAATAPAKPKPAPTRTAPAKSKAADDGCSWVLQCTPEGGENRCVSVRQCK